MQKERESEREENKIDSESRQKREREQEQERKEVTKIKKNLLMLSKGFREKTYFEKLVKSNKRSNM